jgi:tetratricopeptide (TPR) repeat protein
MKSTLLWGAALWLASSATAQPSVLQVREQARQSLREGDSESAARLFAELARENPSDGSLWEALGLAQLRAGNYEASIESYQRAIETGLRPASGHYNIACALSLAGRHDAAIDALAQAYALGFADEHLLRQDSDLAPLHENPKFRRLVGWPDPSVESRSERWRRDIEFLDRRLQDVHWNLFAQCLPEAYERSKQRILSRIDTLDDFELGWQIRCWLAQIGDGHTALSNEEMLALHLGPHAQVQLLPLQFFEYADGLRIKQATPEYAAIAGSKVLAIGSASVDSVLSWVAPGCSRDNDVGAGWIRALLLSDPRVLHGLRLAEGDGSVSLRLQDESGAIRTVAVHPGGAELVHERRPFWDLRQQPLALAQRVSRQPLFADADPAHDLLYVRIDGVHDGPNETLEAFALRTTAMRRQLQLGHLVLDLRNNHGGQGELMRPFLHELIRDADFQTPGSLYVLIGRETFSAAMAFAAQIEVNTSARFVGEPTGSRPNFVGETTLVQMPYSQRWVSISSRYHQNGRSDDRRLWIAPAIPAPPSYALEREGRDPALEAIAREIEGAR